jgi:integrase/recombinase XerD
MDEWGWEELQPWLTARVELPVGPLFCIIDGPTRGRPWSGAAVRSEFRRLAARAGLRRRFAPHQLRHAHALELAREGVPLNTIQRQLGHANLGTTSIYLQGIDPDEASTYTRFAKTTDARPRRACRQRSARARCFTIASASVVGPDTPAQDDTRASEARTGSRPLTRGEAEAPSRACDSCPSS